MTTNTGGPAFPVSESALIRNLQGMTLRDYFAAKAMQGLLSNPKLADEILKCSKHGHNWIQQSAWGWADEVLKAKDA